MQRKGKSPPININELTDKRAEAEKGTLGYVKGKDKKLVGRALDINWTQVLVSCVISLILAVVIISLVAPSQESVSNLVTEVNKLSSQVDSIGDEVATMGKYIDADELEGEMATFRDWLNPNFVSAKEFSRLSSKVVNVSTLTTHFGNRVSQLELDLDETKIKSDINSLKKSLNQLDVGISFLLGEIAKLEDRIEELEK